MIVETLSVVRGESIFWEHYLFFSLKKCPFIFNYQYKLYG